jgi:hypothetical protein
VRWVAKTGEVQVNSCRRINQNTASIYNLVFVPCFQSFLAQCYEFGKNRFVVRQLLGFARATGDQHAAVWFWKSAPKIKDGKLTGADLASKIDANACAAYSKKLKLNVTKSPYVVMTTSYFEGKFESNGNMKSADFSGDLRKLPRRAPVV